MKILIDIGHPAHVHFFKNVFWGLKKNGHDVMVTSRDKDLAIDLLEAYGIPHTVLTGMGSGKINLMKEWIIRDFKLLLSARKFEPDILIGMLNPCVAHISKFIGKKAIIFNDTEHATFAGTITYPFADIICTPSCFKKNLGKKHIKFDGYKEMAYLHPNYFRPDPTVLEHVGLSKNDRFTVLRFISLNASHDTHSNDGLTDPLGLVRTLEDYGHVFITSEKPLGKKLKDYELKIPPEKIHSLLSYAQLYLGGGETMAVEAAILGTPSIDVEAVKIAQSRFVDISFIHGNAHELINRYKLMFAFTNQAQALEKAIEILENGNSKKEWEIKRKKLFEDKIDVTKFMMDLIQKTV